MDEIPKTTPLEALQLAIELAGGQSALARLCGGRVKQAHVWNWLNRNRALPSEHARTVEEALGGKVTRYQLRPDVFGESPQSELAA